MSDDTIEYRITIWIDGQKHDWTYELEESTVSSTDRLDNKRVPVDYWPDELKGRSTDVIEGCEFVASNDRGDGISGRVKDIEHGGAVLVLDDTSLNARWGDEFGQLPYNPGP